MNRQSNVGAPGAVTCNDCQCDPRFNFRGVVRPFSRVFLVVAVIVGLGMAAGTAGAQTVPTVVTDLPDYPPGATVYITGSGFTGSPVIVLQVSHVPEIPGEDSCDPLGHEPWTVIADAEGNFTAQWYIDPCDGAFSTFRLTADDFVFGLHAETTFTDANCGTGWVASVTGIGGACAGRSPSGPGNNDPEFWEVQNGGSYTITMDNVTDCAGSQIQITVGSGTPAFCITLNRVGATNSFTGTFTMPLTACNSYVLNYRCTVNPACNNTAGGKDPLTSEVGHPCRGVSLRASYFSAACVKVGNDTNCTAAGACCVSTTGCQIADPTRCTQLGGTFQGANTTCANNPCPGACCVAAVCSSRTLAQCQTLGGTFQGPGTSCTPNPCVSPCTITCPSNLTVECGQSTAPLAPPLGTGVAVCGNTSCSCTVSSSDFFTPGCGNTGVITRTWTCTCPSGGLPATCVQVITIVDTTPPVFAICPIDLNLGCNPPIIPACDVNQVLATDACGAVTVTCATAPDVISGCNRTRTITYTAKDQCNNSTTCVQHITWKVDTTPPVFAICPVDQSLGCNPTSIPACDLNQVSATDNCGPVTYQCSQTETVDGCNHTRVVTYTAFDGCNNSTECVQHITWKEDHAAPVLSGCPGNVSVQCAADVPAAASVTASDNCDAGTPVDFSQTQVGSACDYTITRTWTATDGCGNSASCSQSIHVHDDLPPVLHGCPPASGGSFQCRSAVPAPPEVTATDNCDSTVGVFFDETESNPGSDCNNTITRQWTAVDSCGNPESCVQVIHVNDTTAPTLTGCPADATIQCSDPVPPAASPSANDNCDPSPTVGFSEQIVPGNCPQNYDIVRTWTVADHCDNHGQSCVQTIHIVDTVAPVLGAAGADATIECPAVPVFSAPSANDACDPNPIVVEVSDQTVPGNCPGSYVRTKTWKARDCSGNESGLVSQTISVVDTTSPSISAAGADQTIECPAVPVFSAPSANDACDPNPLVIEVSDETIPGNCPGSYVRTKTWKSRDCSGNESGLVSQTISVVDTTSPSISAAENDATIECPAVPVFSAPSANDACDPNPLVIEVSDETVAGNCPGSYVRTKTWKSRDCSGNESGLVSQTISVVDTTSPSISAAGADATIECPAAPVFSAPSANDACDPNPLVIEVSDVMGNGNCPGSYTRTKTWETRDCSGNTSGRVSQSITVVDTTAPVLSAAPPNASYQCIGDVPGPATLTANDACAGNVAVSFTESQTHPASSCQNVITRTWLAIDNCGHSSSRTQVINVNVNDTTAPTLNACPPNMLIPCSVSLLVPVTFALPGAQDNCGTVSVSSSPVSGSMFPIGNTTVTCTAVDSCGNTRQCSFTVSRSSLGFTGFLSPIGGADATGGSFGDPLRTFKHGSTIPVKFTGNCGGGPVLTGIHTIQAIKYSSMTSSDPPVDPTPTDAATTGNQFRLTGDQWHFNMSTKSGFSPGTWKVVATLSDGSKHEVWIALKK